MTNSLGHSRGASVLSTPLVSRSWEIVTPLWRTGWQFSSFKTSSWHWFESWVVVWGPHTKSQLSSTVVTVRATRLIRPREWVIAKDPCLFATFHRVCESELRLANTGCKLQLLSRISSQLNNLNSGDDVISRSYLRYEFNMTITTYKY